MFPLSDRKSDDGIESIGLEHLVSPMLHLIKKIYGGGGHAFQCIEIRSRTSSRCVMFPMSMSDRNSDNGIGSRVVDLVGNEMEGGFYF